MEKNDNIEIMINNNDIDYEDNEIYKQFELKKMDKDKEISIRHPNVMLPLDKFMYICQSLSNNIININENVMINNKMDVEIKRKKTKAEIIIEENNERKRMNDIKEKVKMINHYIEEINNVGMITFNILEGMVKKFNTEESNIIMKVMMLKELINRYKNTSDKELIKFIFELLMLNKEIVEKYDYLDKTGIKMMMEDNIIDINENKMTGRQLRARNKTLNIEEITNITEEDLKEINIKVINTSKKYIRIAEDMIKREKINMVKYQMVEMYHRMRPLCNWDINIFKLEKFQEETIKYINNKKSVLVIAPTSAGKTVCSQYCLKVSKRVLYVVPCEVLANQIVGMLLKSDISTALVTNNELYGEVEKAKVVVATPEKAEEVYNMNNTKFKFEYVVFDEIQQINEDEGECIERIIKIVECPYLILTATIQEPEKFTEYLRIVTNQEVNIVKHVGRFIIQQKYIYEDKKNELIKLHPFSCIDIEYIRKDKFKSGDLAMTARDLYELGMYISELIGDEMICPEKYFENKYISMDDLAIYDMILKDKIVELSDEIIMQILYKFSDNNDNNNDNKDNNDKNEDMNVDNKISEIINMLNKLKDNDMFPVLTFMMNDVAVLSIYEQIINELEYKEELYFPWYKDFMKEIYDEINLYMMNEEELRETISKGIKTTGGKMKEINDQVNQNKRRFIENIMNKVKAKYNEEIRKMNDKKMNVKEIENMCNFLKEDYNKKYNKYCICQMDSVDVQLPNFNPYSPMLLFSFRKEELDINTMRDIKNNLNKYLLDREMNNEINYNNIFIRGIERGIILYSKILPIPYQRIVQELIIKKQVPICICDDSLAYGVNFPTRSVIILGSKDNEEISVLKGQQMSGRSGRRGYDTQGNIIYYRINYKNVMRGTYTPLIGKETITPFILLQTKINDKSEEGKKEYIRRMLQIPLQIYVENKNEYDVEEMVNQFRILYENDDNGIYKLDGLMLLLVWLFRDEPNIVYNLFMLINKVIKYNVYIEKENKEIEHKIVQGKKTIYKKRKEIVKSMNNKKMLELVEILCRVLDNDNNDDNNDNNDNDNNNDNNEWIININNDETYIRNIINNNENKDKNKDYEYRMRLVKHLDKIILNTLKIYNLFAQLGNEIITETLKYPLDYLISLTNKIKTFN